jgi:putative membrane protein
VDLILQIVQMAGGLPLGAPRDAAGRHEAEIVVIGQLVTTSRPALQTVDMIANVSGLRRTPPVLLAGVIVVLVVSGIRPHDWVTWLLEIFWVLIGIPVVLVTWRRFPLTTLLCCLMAMHAVILCVGGHYTYALTPVGDWVRDLLHLSRNPYDRLGHFAQGFVPVIGVREVLARRSPLRDSRWLAPLAVCVCLAFSAFYELIEWWAAVLGGSAADAFLGTQGDVWDTQWDMCMALIGAVLAVTTLGRWHDRQVRRLVDSTASTGEVGDIVGLGVRPGSGR